MAAQGAARARTNGGSLYSEIPTYHERLTALTDQLREQGHLALVLVDASELARVEHDYGSRAFEQVLTTVSVFVEELHGTEIRAADLLALNDRGGNAFLLFLSPRRGGEGRAASHRATSSASPRAWRSSSNRRLAALASPYLRGRPKVTVGFSVVFHNPLIMAERVISRLVNEAWESVRIKKMQAEFQTRCRLQDVLLGQQITTVFQPIVDLQRRRRRPRLRGPLARPRRTPRSTARSTSSRPRRRATSSFELDRHCRRPRCAPPRALPAPHQLFVNVVPASMYDPDFQGA